MVRTLSIRSFMRLRHRSSVDLPQPDGPMSAVTWWQGKSMRDVAEGLGGAVVEMEVLDADDRRRPARRGGVA